MYRLGIGFGNRISFAPDEGGGAMGSAPGITTAAPASATTPATTTPGEGATPPAESVGQPLRDLFKANAKAWADELKPPEGEKPPEKTGKELHDSVPGVQKPGDIAGQEAAPPKPPEAEKPPEEKKPVEVKPPEGEKPPEAEKPPEGTADFEIEVAGIKFNREETIKHVEYAMQANAFLNAQGSKLKEHEDKLVKREQELNDLFNNNPDAAILNTLKQYPVLRDKFFELSAEMLPTLKGEHKTMTVEQELALVKKELADMKAGINNDKTDAEAKKQKAEEAQKEAYIQETTKQAYDFASAKAAEHKIPLKIFESIINDTASRVEHGALKFTMPDLKAHIEGLINEFVSIRGAGAKEAVDGFVQERSELPPPPPTGGGVPRLGEGKAKTFEEANDRFIQKLQGQKR